MRTQKRTRLLSALMALLMVFSLLPASALAADTTSTWEQVALADIKETDTVAITMTKADVTYALPANNTGKSPVAETATISNGMLTISGEASAFGWTVSAYGTGYTFKNSNGEYLYVDAGVVAPILTIIHAKIPRVG